MSYLRYSIICIDITSGHCGPLTLPSMERYCRLCFVLNSPSSAHYGHRVRIFSKYPSRFIPKSYWSTISICNCHRPRKCLGPAAQSQARKTVTLTQRPKYDKGHECSEEHTCLPGAPTRDRNCQQRTQKDKPAGGNRTPRPGVRPTQLSH